MLYTNKYETSKFAFYFDVHVLIPEIVAMSCKESELYSVLIR